MLRAFSCELGAWYQLSPRTRFVRALCQRSESRPRKVIVRFALESSVTILTENRGSPCKSAQTKSVLWRALVTFARSKVTKNLLCALGTFARPKVPKHSYCALVTFHRWKVTKNLLCALVTFAPESHIPFSAASRIFRVCVSPRPAACFFSYAIEDTHSL